MKLKKIKIQKKNDNTNIQANYCLSFRILTWKAAQFKYKKITLIYKTKMFGKIYPFSFYFYIYFHLFVFMFFLFFFSFLSVKQLEHRGQIV